MKYRPILATFVFLAAMAPDVSTALDAYPVATVNMRAGPSTRYPVVDRVPEGEPVRVYGCLSDGSWCDVGSEYDRGWIAARLLHFDGRLVLRDLAPHRDWPVTECGGSRYWDSHYRDRSWYGEREMFFSRDRDLYDPVEVERPRPRAEVVRPPRAKGHPHGCPPGQAKKGRC